MNVTNPLPPLLSHVAIYRDRQRVALWLMAGLTIFFIAIFSAQEWRISKLTQALSDRDYLIVPGAPEFMRIRPGFIADESVYLFAEYAANLLSTFSYNTVEGQYRTLSEFMTPELKTKFLMSTEKALKMYRDLRVDQVFDLEPVKKYELKKDERGPKYIVRARGQTRKYVEGNLRETVPSESVIFTFRPRKVKPNTPWFFEIENFERLTPEEEQKRDALASIPQPEAK